MQRCKPETVTSQNTLWRKKSSQTLALTVALFSSSLRIARRSILHRNCQQKAPTRDTQNSPHTAKKFPAHSELQNWKCSSSTVRDNLWSTGFDIRLSEEKISTQEQQQQQNVRRTSLVYQVIEGTAWRRQCTASSLSSRCSCTQCHWPHAIAHTGNSTSLLLLSPLLSPPLLVSRANLQQSPQAWATTKLQILLHTFFCLRCCLSSNSSHPFCLVGCLFVWCSHSIS